MPTKLARTVASSVCGRVLHWSSVTTTATAAPTTMRPPSSRPATRALGFGSAPCGGMLDPEQRHPENEGDEKREARIHERSRAEVGVHAQSKEEPPGEHGDDDADRGAEHPRGEERADDVDLRTHGVPQIGRAHV